MKIPRHDVAEVFSNNNRSGAEPSGSGGRAVLP